jgi:ABC-type transport system involved in cytochrome c biogenesis permease subunit
MKQKQPPAWVPWAILGVAALYLVGQMVPRNIDGSEFHLAKFGTLPVQEGGRIQPLDTFARIRLMHISHRMEFTHRIMEEDPRDPEQEIEKDSVRMSPNKWLLDTLTAGLRDDSPVFDYRMFRIDNPDVVTVLGLPHRPGNWRYSWNEFADKAEFRNPVRRILENDGPDPNDIVEVRIAELYRQVAAFEGIVRRHVRLVHPPPRLRAAAASDDDHWLTFDQAAEQRGVDHRSLEHYAGMLRAYIADNPEEFNEALAQYQRYLERARPAEYHKAAWEAFFNRFAPFYHSIALYALVFILGVVSWLVWDNPWASWHKPLRTAAIWVTVLTLAVHTWALILRIYFTGRPPVTNLYSSAVFIGWGGVCLCLGLEWIFKNGVGIVGAAYSGMASLIIAHNLVSGDTMEMLQAVLDTNFWLATHVVCITMGYKATFVAGFIGMVYVLLGVFTTRMRGELATSLPKMMYGVVCFATLLSFVGTVLGGIWADESWGRFWGWDPKENGALLLVIWNALILHARWGGMIKARGLANLAIFGNCVTLWSWFGTNMLGVGLHAYGGAGGLSAGALWVIGAVIAHLILIGIGCTPLSEWKSFKPTPPPTAGAGGSAPESAALVSAGASS